jgi:hypothetical protein
VILVVGVAGCAARANSAAAKGVPSDLAQVGDMGLEVASTTQDQARDEILSTPTVFTVDRDQDSYSWDRAKFFLENYIGVTPQHSSVMTRVVGSRFSLVSNPAQESYTYEVAKEMNKDGFLYSVTCTPTKKGSPAQAALNAGSFARFIKDGKLEISLLPQQSAR